MLTSVRALGLATDGAGGGGGAGGAGGATGVGAGATAVAGASILTGSGRTSGLAGSGLGCSGRGGSGRGCGFTGSGLGGWGFGFGGSGVGGSSLSGGSGVSNCTMTGGGSTSVWGFSSAPDTTKAISAPCSAIATASADGLMLGTARLRLRLSADRARPACRTGQWLCAAGNERRASCHAHR